MERSRWIDFLINRYSKQLVRYATALSKDKDAARDIVQRCLLLLLQQETPVRREAVQVWLYRECRLRSLEFYRQNLKPGGSADPAVFVDPALDSDAMMVNKPNLVRKAVKELDPRHQEIFWLKYRDELSFTEIGEILQLTPGHIGMVLFECTLKLGPVVSEQEPLENTSDALDRAKWMALIHNQGEMADRNPLVEKIEGDEVLRHQHERLKTYAKSLQQAFSERAQEGLSPAQLAGLYAKAPARPMGWATWAAGFSFVTATLAGILLYIPQPQEPAAHEESRTPATVTVAPSPVTNVPIELEKEFSPSPSAKPEPPAPSNPQHVTVVRALTKVPPTFNRAKVLGHLAKQLQGENTCLPSSLKHKELVGVVEISKAGAVTGFNLRTKVDDSKRINECLKKKLAGKTEAFKNSAKGPTKLTLTLRL